MPLRALTSTGSIHAFEYEEARWAALKGEYKSLGLCMPCCRAAAVPKTSPLGNFFFAHSRTSECTTAPESPEHLYCKSLVAQAAQQAGWTVTTERSGATPSGETWVADVFCEKGNAQVALEIQLSPQAWATTQQRQSRYRESGVRGAWFLGPRCEMGSNQASRDTPAFTLSEVQVGHLPRIREFDIELTSFVKALLSRQLTWSAHESDEPIYVEYLSDICWACKHPVKQVYGHFLNLEDAAGGLLPRAFTVATLSKALESLMLAVSAEELAVLGLNRIERHNVIRGKPTQWPYLNACCHCSAPQDNYFLGQKLVAALHNPDGGGFRVDRVEVRRIVAGKGRWALAITATDSNT